MKDIQIYNQSDLVLKVNTTYDPGLLNLDKWSKFLDVLCGDREFQKEAIKTGVVYLASENYSNLEDLIKENYTKNTELQKRYSTLERYLNDLQLGKELFANIDLATGTGKSYVMFGIAQIMMGIGLVERVLVLCPSTTIEKELYKKYLDLSSDSNLRAAIPEEALIKSLRIIDANSTIKKGDLCVENIHAVYSTTGSSIYDSFKYGGQDTLVLNDESHHIFNALQSISGRTTEGQNIKKWKEFLLNSTYQFKYMLGFTGTAYHENEYFNDVIYRYSLKDAIDDKVVKSINYVQKDDNNEVHEKFQKIYQNHQNNKTQYSLIKPLSILVTKDVNNAKQLREDLVDFLMDQEGLSYDEVDSKVLTVTSHEDHKENLLILPYVDDKENKVEWIVSVSMLTEGWDVKNVFQIVPWQDRAFNSKLLIAQVMGRGLRVPKEYQAPQPSVTIFNHDAWSKNIKSLVREVLEIETKVTSFVLKSGEKARYNFKLKNLKYDRDETEINHPEIDKPYDYSKVWERGIKLDSQIELSRKETSYEKILSGKQFSIKYDIKHKTISINEVSNKVHRQFKVLDMESKVLGLGSEEVYSKENLPPLNKIKEIIRKSMDNVNIKGDRLTEKNAQKVYQTFSTLMRRKGKTIVNELKSTEPFVVSTEDMSKNTINMSSLRKDSTVFYNGGNLKDLLLDDEKDVFETFLKDGTFPRSASERINPFLFKTSLNIVSSDGEPERSFINLLCKEENAEKLTSWIKSRDIGFYSIEYSYREGGHSKQRLFNPDFFIKCKRGATTYFLVIEIKEDNDVTIQNKAKYKYGKRHFELLNHELPNDEKYIFHFLSPNGYDAFFEYFQDGRLFDGQEKFRCELENILEDKL